MSDAPHRILDLPMDENDANAKTIREYMQALLRTLLTEVEAFSGKRPFGNSGWDWDMHKPLVKAGLVIGTIDKYGDLDHDDKHATRLLLEAIKDL